MKKVIIALSIFAVCATTESKASKCYTSHQDNTNRNGTCNEIDERRPNDDDYVLFCTNPGSKVCKFSDGTLPKVVDANFSNIQQTVTDQIANGVLQGSADFSDGTYTWDGIDVNNLTFSIFSDAK
ncbi:hypothetical protein ACEN9X_09380 [Mucilaginibacter sp. Mucisp86]|uniref:hypothetical protein n=1 Tax=Mucilaginibacter sp. Mucisp86 TaxID=3243060 RepID=UPI0039B45817